MTPRAQRFELTTDHADTALGRRIGLLIVDWAARDGFAGTRGRAYTPPVGVGTPTVKIARITVGGTQA